MIKLSNDVIKSIEYSTLFMDENDQQISIKHLFFGLAYCDCANSYEILRRLGIDKEFLSSYIDRDNINNIKNYRFSTDAEKAIQHSKEIAKCYDYLQADTQHLLLSIVELSSKEISQVLLDFQISYSNIKDIVDAMSYNDIGRNEKEYKKIKINYTIKNKKLEQNIQRILYQTKF